MARGMHAQLIESCEQRPPAFGVDDDRVIPRTAGYSAQPQGRDNVVSILGVNALRVDDNPRPLKAEPDLIVSMAGA